MYACTHKRVYAKTTKTITTKTTTSTTTKEQIATATQQKLRNQVDHGEIKRTKTTLKKFQFQF